METTKGAQGREQEGSTPGPWRVHYDSAGLSIVTASTIVAAFDMGEISAADARLIAAAPTLYAALQRAAAGFAVIANHAGAEHPGLADSNNVHAIRGFAHENFCLAKSALARVDEGKERD